jgi:hypothetical protein
MKDAKVINLRERLAGNKAGGSEAAGADASSRACQRCGGRGVVDFLDLVARRAKLHCQGCQHYWDEQLPEPDDARAKALVAAAADRRLHHRPPSM